MKSTICCAKCGAGCDPEQGEGVECPECGKFFCDNCYDTGKGDNCQCHNEVQRSVP